MLFWEQVLIYLIRFMILGAVAVAGVFVGKTIRAHKDRNKKTTE